MNASGAEARLCSYATRISILFSFGVVVAHSAFSSRSGCAWLWTQCSAGHESLYSVERCWFVCCECLRAFARHARGLSIAIHVCVLRTTRGMVSIYGARSPSDRVRSFTGDLMHDTRKDV